MKPVLEPNSNGVKLLFVRILVLYVNFGTPKASTKARAKQVFVLYVVARKVEHRIIG